MKYLRAAAAVAVLAIALFYLRGYIVQNSSRSNSPAAASSPSPDKADSLWVVVNKGRILPATYVPAGLVRPAVALRPAATTDEQLLRKDAAGALQQMFAEAGKDGLSLMIASGYRSYATQQQVYGFNVNIQGASADETSARPGHSEHQTGLAADIEPASQICEVQDCFSNTPEGQWLQVNSYKFGFIIRYTQSNKTATGYLAEPWHIRYVGDDLAAKLTASGQTLEQYFKLPFYLDYPASFVQLK